MGQMVLLMKLQRGRRTLLILSKMFYICTKILYFRFSITWNPKLLVITQILEAVFPKSQGSSLHVTTCLPIPTENAHCSKKVQTFICKIVSPKEFFRGYTNCSTIFVLFCISARTTIYRGCQKNFCTF